jgi:prepilin-type N-terminal cleavage/methylation domain-containing protein
VRRGLTLIELVVVIGIIAIVVSFALPAVARTRRAAIKLTQSAAMQEVSTLLHIYLKDHRDVFPFVATEEPANTAALGYAGVLAKNGGFERTRIGNTNQFASIAENFQMSLAFVYKHEKMVPGETELRSARRAVPVNVSSVVYPSDKASLSTIRDVSSSSSGPQSFWCCVPGMPSLPVAMVDGSIESRTFTEMLPSGVYYTENEIGVPAFSTWYGVRGRDRR